MKTKPMPANAEATGDGFTYRCKLCGQTNFSAKGIKAHLTPTGEGNKACQERRRSERPNYDFHRGYFCAVSVLLRETGLVDTQVRSLFSQGGKGWEHADHCDIELFKQFGLISRTKLQRKTKDALVNNRLHRTILYGGKMDALRAIREANCDTLCSAWIGLVTLNNDTHTRADVERYLKTKFGRVAGVCRGCGCVNERACLEDGKPCHWVECDLCSACVEEEAE